MESKNNAQGSKYAARNTQSRPGVKDSHVVSNTRSGRFNSRMSTMLSSRRKGGTMGATMRSSKSRKNAQRVWLNGVDVTPRSLLDSNTQAGKKHRKKGQSKASSILSSVGFKDAGSSFISKNISVAGGSLLRHEASSMSAYSASSVSSDIGESASEVRSVDSDIGSEESVQGVAEMNEDQAELEDVDEAQQENASLTAEQLDATVRIDIVETDTMTLLRIPSLCVWANDKEEMEHVTKVNDDYDKMVCEHKSINKFSSRHMQTFNLPTKSKDIQVTPPHRTNTGSQSSRWDIFDAFHGVNNVVEKTKRTNAALSNEAIRAIEQSEKFGRAITVMEEVVIQNTMHEKHQLYRNAKTSYTSDKNVVNSSNTSTLQNLWTFSCPTIQSMNVSALEWNKQNQDMLASAFGPAEYSGTEDSGYILLWTLKNHRHPLRTIHSRIGVTSLSFSNEHPHLLAAGFYDGTLAVYDIRVGGDVPAVRSSHGTVNHSDAVWSVRWAGKDEQQLMSVSTDGHVKNWSMKKGLIPSDIMLLKRISNQATLYAEQPEGMINRHAASLCFDFSKRDSSHYLIGTEDGIVHQCSTSYNEQVLESYFGHTAPVYRVLCSPFHRDAFLTCSADWTIKLWSQRSTKPILSFNSGHDYITDIDWSPTDGCVFSSVSRDGRLEIWDLEWSTLNPIIQRKVENTSLSTVLFGRKSPVIMTGSRTGDIDVYRMFRNESQQDDDQAEHLERIMYSSREQLTSS